MRFLIFLILGTLIFGLVFPAFIVLVGLLLLIFMVIGIFGSLTGIFRNKRVIIYQNGRRFDAANDKKRNKESTADNPEIITSDEYAENQDVYDFGDQAEPEIIELPSSALRKDDEEGRDG